MLLFSTVLDIDSSLTKEEFVRLVIEWNQNTPHRENAIPDIVWDGERNIRYGNDTLWLEISEYRNGNIIAARYEKVEDDGIVWDTDFVMNFNDMQMAIMLDRSYKEDALASQIYFSVPHLITMLMDRGYLMPDGDLPVDRNPIMIQDDNLDVAADVINGNKKYRLPVVYVSKTYSDENPVDVRKLANKLKGVAHVLIQKDACSNQYLRKLCGDKNEYYGAIGVYYPNSSFQHATYLYRRYAGEDAILFEKVIRAVFRYSNSQKISRLYTWNGVNNAILTDRLTSQKAERLEAELALRKAEDEVDQIYDAFGDDLEKHQRRVEELTHANEALRSENAGLRAKIDATNTLPIIFFGDEDELYPGEIRDMVLYALSEALKNVHGRSRRADVYKDILAANEYKKLCEERQYRIKQVLTGYSGMSKTVRQKLMDLGFEITEDGRHYKLTYYGDRRYWSALAKTPSENRGNKNAASDIINNMF